MFALCSAWVEHNYYLMHNTYARIFESKTPRSRGPYIKHDLAIKLHRRSSDDWMNEYDETVRFETEREAIELDWGDEFKKAGHKAAAPKIVLA